MESKMIRKWAVLYRSNEVDEQGAVGVVVGVVVVDPTGEFDLHNTEADAIAAMKQGIADRVGMAALYSLPLVADRVQLHHQIASNYTIAVIEYPDFGPK
jgi:hypothetical protein